MIVRTHLQQSTWAGSQLTSFDSGSDENMACYGWNLLVCLPNRPLDSHDISESTIPVLISSWELVTTLDYEWGVIRRQRPFRWTIYVRINALHARALDQCILFGRSTPLHAYLLLSL